MNDIMEFIGSAMREMLKLPAAVAAYLALFGVVLTVVLAFGMVPQVFGGFAHANRLNRIAVELNEHVTQIAKLDNAHWANQTAGALLSMDQAKCRLPQGRLRSLYDQLIQRRMQEYYSLTHEQYPLPRCRDL